MLLVPQPQQLRFQPLRVLRQREKLRTGQRYPAADLEAIGEVVVRPAMGVPYALAAHSETAQGRRTCLTPLLLIGGGEGPGVQRRGRHGGAAGSRPVDPADAVLDVVCLVGRSSPCQ